MGDPFQSPRLLPLARAHPFDTPFIQRGRSRDLVGPVTPSVYA